MLFLNIRTLICVGIHINFVPDSNANLYQVFINESYSYTLNIKRYFIYHHKGKSWTTNANLTTS